MSENRKTVMISSTARDLPLHRKQLEDACLRQSMFPTMMERLPASSAEAIGASLDMVDKADVYLGVLAWRYGYVPESHDISVTEIEYERAKERGIPRLIFIMHDDHPVKRTDVETGPGEEKLKDFKERVGKENIVNFFISSEELAKLAINSLSQLRDHTAPHQFHYVSAIPQPPEAYIAHPYTLSQARGLVGRQAELTLLTDWITGKGHFATVRIFNVVAIGGMGKSALTWKWFNEIAPQEWPQMQGRMWWSFYESDAYFENFIIRALAYVSRRSIEGAKQVPPGEREEQLLRILDREPHLLVLDGLERVLIAYARMDAAHLADDDYDRETANRVAGALGLPESAAQSFTGEHRMRKTADPRAGNFLRKLTQVRASRILISTRLYPFDLQMITGSPLPACFAIFLNGLSDADALELWRHFGVSGSREELLPLFHRFGSHPLLLQILAGEVARWKRAPGDFAHWREANPAFDPFRLNVKQAKTHVLQFAMQGLSEAERRVLHIIAAFRMPAQYDTLLSLCCGEGKPCVDEASLNDLLTELEDRGLVGWDRRANRYDLHPVVQGVVWSGVSVEGKQTAYTVLQGYFEAAPKVNDWQDVNILEDLTPAIELFHALIGLGRFDEAYTVFKNKISDATLYRLGASRERMELLEKLFLDGLEKPPRLTNDSDKAYTFNGLAQAYQVSGEPKKASFFFEKHNVIHEKRNDASGVAVGLCNLSNALRFIGRLQESATAARRALEISRDEKDYYQEAVSLNFLSLSMAAAGQKEGSGTLLEQSLKIHIEEQAYQCSIYTYLAQRAIWLNEPSIAQSFTQRAWQLGNTEKYERGTVRAARLQGESALGLSEKTATPTNTKVLVDEADERLQHALTRARAINSVEEELPTLVALAELRRQQDRPAEAREFLDDLWEAAERGPFRLIHADACNVLCQLERDANNLTAATEAALQAYRLAWCDGPPWAYHYGLENAKAHLQALGVAEPDMSAVAPTKDTPDF